MITIGEGNVSAEVCIEVQSDFIDEILYPITLEVVTAEVTAGTHGEDIDAFGSICRVTDLIQKAKDRKN